MIKRLALLACLVTLFASFGCRGGDSSGSNINDPDAPYWVGPHGFVAVGGNTTVDFDWNAATDNIGVTGYIITQTSPTPSVERNVGNVLSYQWTGLLNGTGYTFELNAYDASGNRSTATIVATATPTVPDDTPPTDVSGLTGQGGYHIPGTMDYVQLSIWWTASSSADLSHYLLYISSDGGTTWNILDELVDPPDAADPVYIGNVSSITVPYDGVSLPAPLYPVTMAELNPPTIPFSPSTFSIGVEYTIRVVAVDTSGNESAGVTASITPTPSQDLTPPGAVRNLTATPSDGVVTLAWDEPLPTGEAVSYEVYWRIPADNDTTAWQSWGSVPNSPPLDAQVLSLTNGQLYEFMVCAVDGSANEHPGAATADRADDTAANKITAIPSSGAILCRPNIRGGVFRTDYFNGRNVVVMVHCAQPGILSSDANTRLIYTLDGSPIDPSVTTATATATKGIIEFAPANVDAVSVVTAQHIYAVTIDFVPYDGALDNDYTTGTQAEIDTVSQNALRSNGGPDHIIFRYQVRTATDASDVFEERYLIYPPDDWWNPGDDIWIDLDNDGRFDTGETEAYNNGDGWDVLDQTPGITGRLMFDNTGADNDWDPGEDIWLEDLLANNMYDEETHVYDNGDGWDVTQGGSGTVGLLVYDNTDANGAWDTGDDIWADDVITNLLYDVETQVWAGGDAWTTGDGTAGVTNVLFYDNTDGNGMWNPGEDIWIDSGTTTGIYDAGDTQVYDNADGWGPTADVTPGVTTRMYFADTLAINGTWDTNEDIWYDERINNTLYDTETRVYDGGDGWTATDGTAGINTDLLFDNANRDGVWNSGDDVWLDDLVANLQYNEETQVSDNGDGWDPASGAAGSDGSASSRPIMFDNTLYKKYLKFSGMRDLRDWATATYIETSDGAGDIVSIGGYGYGVVLNSAERYRNGFEHFEAIAPVAYQPEMQEGRMDHRATLLPDRHTILVTGGYDPINYVSPSDAGNRTVALGSYELFEADTSLPNGEGFKANGSMDIARRFQTVSRLLDGRVLITGGLNGETNIYGSAAFPLAAVNLGPKRDVISQMIPPSNSDRGAIAEIIRNGIVHQTGIVTGYTYNDVYGWYDVKVDGLTEDVENGTRYRIINGATDSIEDFTSAGVPGATIPASIVLNYPRFGHSATLLQDGTVFIAGGLYDYAVDTDDRFEYSCEIYNPLNDTIARLSALSDLSTTRFFHNAILLRDGKVLITGGLKKGDGIFTSKGFKGASALLQSVAELYDPYSGSVESVGSMTRSRFMHSAVLLESGKVMICGGFTSITTEGILVIDNTAEIYDPATRKFTSTGTMLTQRGPCMAQVIRDTSSPVYGKALVCGGAFSTLAEVYNESTGLFSATAHGVTGDRFIGASSTMLADGTVLVAGGQTDELFKSNQLVQGDFLKTAELYNSSEVKFEVVGAMVDARRHHAATRLQDGTVLITGGENATGGLSGTELYDPSTKAFTKVADMLNARYKHTATLLPNGKVLIVGGGSKAGALQSCELYNPTSQLFTSVGSLQKGRYDHQAALLPNGWVLITGGANADDQSIEIFDSANGIFLTGITDTMITGRDGHTAICPAYTIGRARFTNGSTAVIGSTTAVYGLEDTAWQTSGRIRAGDIIMSRDSLIPYIIESITNDNTLVLGDHAIFTYDDFGYNEPSTDQKLTAGLAANQGFEDYVILSQDVYIAGGDVYEVSTEVFQFDQAADWPAADPTAYGFVAAQDLVNGRNGHTMTSLADMSLLITGGSYRMSGEWMQDAATPSDFTDDTWTKSNLEAIWQFHGSFLLSNKMVISIRGHAAQVFFVE